MYDSVIIDGLPGSGTTTTAKLVAQELGFEFVYVGGLQRQAAQAMGLTIERFNQEMRKNPERERELDRRLVARVAQGRVVLDARVQARLPENEGAHRVLLTCQFEERERRVGVRELTP